MNLKEILDELFLECEHGDAEHRQWLKDKFEDYRIRKELETEERHRVEKLQYDFSYGKFTG
jgi:hypothetical protein